MKRKISGNIVLAVPAVVVMTALLLTLFRFTVRQNNACAWQVHTGEPVVRLHVKASGDSPEEQRFKMALVEQVRLLLSRYSPPETGDLPAYLEFVKGCLPELERSLQEFTDSAAQGSRIAVSLSRENFPLRAYGRRIYPAGFYTALAVSIDGGCGENWWCLLFPPLCLPPAEDADEPDAKVSLSGEAKEAAREKEPGGTVRWRSMIWELLKRSGRYLVEKVEQIFYN